MCYPGRKVGGGGDFTGNVSQTLVITLCPDQLNVLLLTLALSLGQTVEKLGVVWG